MKCPWCETNLNFAPGATSYCQANSPVCWLNTDEAWSEIKAMTEPRDPLLQEREKTHGDFRLTAKISQDLKYVMKHTMNKLEDVRQLEALDMIATKLARILSGVPKEKDHWLDLAGYAKLGAEACD